MRNPGFLRRYPVLVYFLLTLLISWGGLLLLAGPANIPGTPAQTDALFPIALGILFAGTLVSGILLTALYDGKSGLKTLLSRGLKGRVGLVWYGLTLLGFPVVVLVVLLALSLYSPDYLPNIFTTDDKLSLLGMGVAAGIMGGLLEEVGWTGFATPKLLGRYSILSTGLIIGLVWGIWHVLITLWASGDAAGNLSMALFMPPFAFYMLVLPVARVVMVWVYAKTESLLMNMLMHASLTASTLFVFQPAATENALIGYYVVLAVVLGGLVGLLLGKGQ